LFINLLHAIKSQYHNEMKKLSTFIIIILSCFIFQNIHAQTARDVPDMKTMLSIFEGEFDNFQQVHNEKENKETEIHEHIHSIFAPIKLPFLGENIFYVKQYMDGDPNKIYRQRLYSFKQNPSEKAIQLDIYSFKTDSLYYDANKKPEKLNGLSMDKLTISQGCEVYWKQVDEKFIGYMKPKACNFISKRSGKRIFITDSLMLNKEEIWIRDEAYDEDGKYVFGNKAGIHHKLKRVNFFKGYVTFKKEGETGEVFQIMKGVVLHNHGGKVRMLDNEGKPSKYSVELSNVIYGKSLVVMKLAIYEDGKEKSIAYTWANSDSKRIGMNLRWLESGFTKIE
jgi:CpeT/CpcT family (DUF1001)